jgi:sulfur-oxidizing protein SoxB
MVRIGGLDYTIDPTKSLGNRVSDMKNDRGEKIIMDKLYTVSGWAQVNEVGAGRLMWDVTADYLRRQKSLKLDKINSPTIVGVKNNPGIENYEGNLK